MSVAHALLGLLEEESPRHGYELKRRFDSHFVDVWPIKAAQVYSTLGRLHKRGQVDLVGQESGQGPQRKLYSITEQGAAEVEQWLLTPEAPMPQLQSVLFMKVVLALVCGRPAEQFLEQQRAQHQQRMQQLTRMKLDGEVADALLADYALFHLEADLRWIDTTQARLDRLRAEVRQ